MTIILAIMVLFIYSTGHTENETQLADSIAITCDFYNEEIPFDEREDCILYYTNCVVGTGGKWTNKDLFICIKDKYEVKKASK